MIRGISREASPMSDDAERTIAGCGLIGMLLAVARFGVSLQSRLSIRRTRRRYLACSITTILGLAATLAMTIAPVQASNFYGTGSEASTRGFLHRVTVFSDDPNSIHDPRHVQPQTGADKMFAPIGLIWTNHPQPDQGTAHTSHLHMGTAFLVSPCYVLTAYHVVFGYRTGFRHGEQQPEQEVSATFGVGGKTAHAVPVKYGRFSMFPGQDWALLRIEPERGHRCLGEHPNIGWLQLAPLPASTATKKSLSVAGYPADKSSRIALAARHMSFL